ARAAVGQLDRQPVTGRADPGRLTVDILPVLDTDSQGGGILFRIGPISISTRASRHHDDLALPHGSANRPETNAGGLARVDAAGGRLPVDIPPVIDKDSQGGGFSFRLGPLPISAGASRVDVDVELPHGSSIGAKTKSGDITIVGEAGPVKATTGSGDVRLEHA